MSWKIGICDDEAVILQEFQKYLKRAEEDLGTSFACTYFSSAQELSESREDFDILLLDIGMEGMTGMEAARKLRERGNDSILIFITTLTQYALEGYSVHAYEFICKPLEYPRLLETLKNCIRILKERKGGQIEIRFGAQVRSLNINDILYFEVYSHKVSARLCSGEEIPCSGKLGDYELQLTDLHFFRSYQSYLINLRHVQEIRNTEVRVGKDLLPLSKYKRKGLLDAFARYREDLL